VIEKRHRTLSSIYLINDAVASNLAMLCAWFLRFSLKVIPVTKGQQEVNHAPFQPVYPGCKFMCPVGQ